LKRRTRISFVLVGLTTAFLAYEITTYFIAYTDDAYVRSDLVGVAPEITGRITAVHVADNADVRAGDLLVTIDPVPFQLVVNERLAEIEEARARIEAAKSSILSAQDSADAAASALSYAQIMQQRQLALVKSAAVSQQILDKANDDLRRAEAALAAAQASIAENKSDLALQQSKLATAEALLATSQWRLSRTKVPAPTNGAITNLTIRVGDSGTAYQPFIGIVDANAWRIIANFKEYYVDRLEIGKLAWVYLDSHPWRLFRARIAGIARGISREAGPEKLLPYVAPTTDWIRLRRRFPVTLYLLDPPADLTLYMGADARVVIFP
jgi:multidrug efflux system membrane fusion protein